MYWLFRSDWYVNGMIWITLFYGGAQPTLFVPEISLRNVNNSQLDNLPRTISSSLIEEHIVSMENQSSLGSHPTTRSKTNEGTPGARGIKYLVGDSRMSSSLQRVSLLHVIKFWMVRVRQNICWLKYVSAMAARASSHVIIPTHPEDSLSRQT